MTQIADIVQWLRDASEIKVTRVKDRFFKSPSAGGWRDTMLNFYFEEDPNKHVCEIQLVHASMLTARRGLPGHAIYNVVRNASELDLYSDQGIQPKSVFELQRWLIAYEKGDRTRGHPNEWNTSEITDMSYLFNHKKLRKFNEL